MSTCNHFRTLSRYNRWMNETVYAACEAIPDDLRKKDMGAFFRSVHGTLNHLLLADRLWMGRFTRVPFPVASLDRELYADFPTLRAERGKTDGDIESWVGSLTEDRISAPLTFHSVARGRDHTFPLSHCLLHFFNHQTHHRGQLTALLDQLGGDYGVTDLLWLPGAELTPEGFSPNS